MPRPRSAVPPSGRVAPPGRSPLQSPPCGIPSQDVPSAELRSPAFVLPRWRDGGRRSLALLLACLSPLASGDAARGAAGSPVPTTHLHAAPGQGCRQRGRRHVDAIVFGDEPAGLLTALELSRQLRWQTPGRRPQVLVLTEADTRAGLGGTMARSALAYLDRNQVPEDHAALLPPFAPSSELYSRFLRLAGVRQIAVDPARVSRAFQRALRQAGIPVWDRVGLRQARREGDRLCLLDTRTHGPVGADLFIDSSTGAALAQAAGVAFHPGLGPGRLARRSLALGWIFTVEGMDLRQLQVLEEHVSQRLLNPHDPIAQGWLQAWPAYRHNRRRLQQQLLDPAGHLKLIRSYSSDSADQQSPALSIAFHGRSGLMPGLQNGRVLLDKANVALLDHRLSFNALLLRNDTSQNRQVLAGHNRPLPWMRPIARDVEAFFRHYGARRVRWAPELYVRSADQIANPVQALDATTMALGGVPASEALGTFTYALDLRGGIPGVYVPIHGRPTFNFSYGHTLPREIRNLAVLGPAGGFGGLGAGAGRIIELNVSVGQGLAIAGARALQASGPLHGSLRDVDPTLVAHRMPRRITPYGRPTSGSLLEILRRRVQDWLDDWFHPV